MAALAERDITLHRDWLDVVGSVVGRDEHAIRAGVAATLGSDDGTAAFFARLQLDELGAQSAMLVLRQCGVPQMNYALRCTPPPCIEQLATAFDELVMGAAQSKLRLHHDEVEQHTAQRLLRAPLRHGGFGLTSARQTSPAAYLGSLAAVASAPAFAPYREPDCPLPASAQLSAWIAGSVAALVDAAPECEALLPPSPSVFFQHRTVLTTSSLKRALSQQATNSFHTASLLYFEQGQPITTACSCTDCSSVKNAARSARMSLIYAAHAASSSLSSPSSSASSLRWLRAAALAILSALSARSLWSTWSYP